MMTKTRNWRRALAVALVATVATGSLVANQAQKRWKLFNATGASPAPIENISKDPAVRELAQIRSNLYQRSFRPGVDRSRLVAAYEQRDTTTIKEILGMSDVEETMLETRMNELRDKILARYPSLGGIEIKGADCKDCYSGEAIRRIAKWLERQQPVVPASTARVEEEAVMTPDGSSPVGMPEPVTGCAVPQGGGGYSGAGNPTDCEDLQYIAALLVCTTAGPIFYWPCAYVAYCSFCDGDLPSDICLASNNSPASVN